MTAQSRFWTRIKSKTSWESTEGSGSSSGLLALLRKETADHLNSNRFYLIFGLLLVAAAVSLASAANALRESGTTSREFLSLRLFTTSSASIYSFATWLAFLGPPGGNYPGL